MKKFFHNILLFTILVHCIQYGSTTEEEEEILSVRDLTFDNLKKYSVKNSSGVLYRKKDGKTYYPVFPVDNYTYTESSGSNPEKWDYDTTENKKLYDIKTLINLGITRNDNNKRGKFLYHCDKLPGWDGGNLVVRCLDENDNYYEEHTTDEKVYTMSDPNNYTLCSEFNFHVNHIIYDVYYNDSTMPGGNIISHKFFPPWDNYSSDCIIQNIFLIKQIGNNTFLIRPKLGDNTTEGNAVDEANAKKHSSLKIRIDKDGTATNIIVPQGVTWRKKDAMFLCGKYIGDITWGKASVCLIILGNIVSDESLLSNTYGNIGGYYPESNIDIQWPTKGRIIIGPNSNFKHYTETGRGVAPVYCGSPHMEYVLYPGCTINRAPYSSDSLENGNEQKFSYITIGPNGTVLLNRFMINPDYLEDYTDDTEEHNTYKRIKSQYSNIFADNQKIYAKLGGYHKTIKFSSALENVAILASLPVPNNINGAPSGTLVQFSELLTNYSTFKAPMNATDKLEDECFYIFYNYFPNLYFKTLTENDFVEHLIEIINGDSIIRYKIANPSEPLEFDGLSKILSIKSDIVSKFDVNLWKECSINGYYGFGWYNTSQNTDKYIDINKAYKQFCCTPFYNDNDNKVGEPLKININKDNNNTSTIYLGLICNNNNNNDNNNRSIILNTDANTVEFLGNNTLYESSIEVNNEANNNEANNNVNTVYFSNNSFVNITGNTSTLSYVFNGNNDGNDSNNSFKLKNDITELLSVEIKEQEIVGQDATVPVSVALTNNIINDEPNVLLKLNKLIVNEHCTFTMKTGTHISCS